VLVYRIGRYELDHCLDLLWCAPARRDESWLCWTLCYVVQSSTLLSFYSCWSLTTPHFPDMPAFCYGAMLPNCSRNSRVPMAVAFLRLKGTLCTIIFVCRFKCRMTRGLRIDVQYCANFFLVSIRSLHVTPACKEIQLQCLQIYLPPTQRGWYCF